MTTNDVEKLFSKIRGMRCDGTSVIAKGNAMLRQQKSINLKTVQRKKAASSASSKKRSRSYKDASAFNRNKRRKLNSNP